MDWSVTGGDILQLLGFLVAVVVFVMKMDKRLGIMQAELKAQEKRLDSFERGLIDTRHELTEAVTAINERIDNHRYSRPPQ